MVTRSTFFRTLGENEVSYLSKEAFDTLATGEEEANLGVNLSVWSIVKLERGNVDLRSTLLVVFCNLI